MSPIHCVPNVLLRLFNPTLYDDSVKQKLLMWKNLSLSLSHGNPRSAIGRQKDLYTY
jgi:hypothetical protein